MLLGTEVNLGLGDVVLDEVAAPPRGVQPPVFGPCLLWPNVREDEDVTWYRSRLGPGHIVLYEDLAPPAKGAQQPFRPMYSGHGRPSQLLLSSCISCITKSIMISADILRYSERIAHISDKIQIYVFEDMSKRIADICSILGLETSVGLLTCRYLQMWIKCENGLP